MFKNVDTSMMKYNWYLIFHIRIKNINPNINTESRDFRIIVCRNNNDRISISNYENTMLKLYNLPPNKGS